MRTLPRRGRERRELPQQLFRAAMAKNYTDTRDEDPYDEAYTTQAMSIYDRIKMSQFSQVMTRMPISFDEKTAWFVF